MEDKIKDNKFENFNNSNVEILIRLYCFKEELKSNIKNYNKIKPENRIQTGFLICKEIINFYLNLMNNSEFLSVIDKIKTSKKIKDKNILITSEDLDKNDLILKIIIDFSKINPKLYNKINGTNLNNIESDVENPKIISSSQGLFYINDFEIVNIQICELIRKKLSLKYLGNLCKYIIGKNYFLFHFYLSNNEMPTLTEICKFDKNIIFKAEYVIKYNNNVQLFERLKIDGIDAMINHFNKNPENNILVFGNNTINYYKIVENKLINIIKDKISKIEKFIFNSNEETLNKLIYLYYHYFLMNNKINLSKNNNPFEEVYLINHETFLKLKINLEYKLLKDELNEKMNKNEIPKYTYISKLDFNKINESLSKTTIQKYNKKKINIIRELLLIEPKMKAKILNQNDNIIFMDNFEILDLQLLQYFFHNYKEIARIEAKCSFKDGYVIIHLPKYLNENKYITLIGKLEPDSNNFITDFIFIFQKEKEQRDYIDEIIWNKFTNYLISIKGEYSQINSRGKIIGTIIKINDIIIPEKKREKIGLENIGATCYMNSTLQCFAHIKRFVNYFTNDKYKTPVMSNKETLSYSFKILMDKLWIDNTNNKKKYYAPYEFKEKISKLNPLFEGIAANDAKDLINFIVMTLHQELNKGNSDNIFAEEIIDQTNKSLMSQLFMQEFIQKYNSLSSELFYAINYNLTQCCECGIQLYNYQIYFFLIFPLEEVRKFVNFNNNNFININQNVVDIMHCFEYDRRICLMSGDNVMYCNRCKRNTNCTMCTNLVYAPNVLIIILNRGKGKEFDVKLNFREELDITNYIEMTNTGTLYRLIGVITHLGESGMSGHFIAFCKDPFDKKWYKFNDAIVTPVVDFQKEVIDFGMPYLLFFQKCN